MKRQLERRSLAGMMVSMTQNPRMWQNPPEYPSLAGEVVHLWRLELDQPDPVFHKLENTLSGDERARAQRLRHPLARRRFVTGRGLLRAILARYTRTHPADLVFSYGVHGKPFLSALPGVRPPHFNLSHSGTLGLVAVAGQGEVGVDLEELHPVPEMEAIVQRYFSEQERESLLSLPESQRQAGFFNCWTRKEACLKAAGEGFNYPADRFTVSLQPEAPAVLWNGTPAGPLQLYHFDLEPGYVAALACDLAIRRVVFWQMDGLSSNSGSF